MEERINRWAPWVVRLIGLWLLVGALFKLLLGSPADLPPIVRSLPLGLDLTYRLVIMVELAVAGLAFIRPRWAWPLTGGALAVFIGILTMLIAAGETSCGCFGSKITLSPWVMLAIDGALLLALLATVPWRGRYPQLLPTWLLVPAIGIGLIAPWIVDRQASQPPTQAADQSDEGLRSYAILEPEQWIGTELAETDLAQWLDLATLPSDGLWIFYRKTCEHCAEHLFEVAAEDMGERPIVLIRVVDQDEGPGIVDLLPEGDHVHEVTLPEGVDWVLTTPADFELEGGIVTNARETIELH